MLLPQQPVFLWLVRLGSAEVVHQLLLGAAAGSSDSLVFPSKLPLTEPRRKIMLNSTRMTQIFIIDQQPVVRMGLRALLEQDGDLHPGAAEVRVSHGHRVAAQ